MVWRQEAVLAGSLFSQQTTGKTLSGNTTRNYWLTAIFLLILLVSLELGKKSLYLASFNKEEFKKNIIITILFILFKPHI